MLPKYRCDRHCLIMASGAKARQPADQGLIAAPGRGASEESASLLFGGERLVLVFRGLERQVGLFRPVYGGLRARDSLRVTGRSILSFSERSDAVRNA